MNSGDTARFAALRRILNDFAEYSRVCFPKRALRSYQVEATRAILSAVLGGKRGGGYTLLFSRQAGKDETLAQLQSYLLLRYSRIGGSIVMGAPTFKPQCLVSRRRLLDRMDTPLHAGVGGSEGYRVVLGKAGVSFMSTEATANQRGETADVCLIANEAQDIDPAIWDTRLAPMAASTNAPAMYSGTPWFGDSLLSREIRESSKAGTLFSADWERVALEVPAYGEYVRAQILKLGARHPAILTEYCLIEQMGDSGLFPERRRAQMHGSHPRRSSAEAGKLYAMLLDVAGEEEGETGEVDPTGANQKRDSTALTVVEIDLASCRDPLVGRPTYRVVDRQEWVGKKHSSLLPLLRDLATQVWGASYFVVDCTGVGAGLASFLTSSLSRRCKVIPFTFSQASKSQLGWDFLSVIETGRYKEYAPDGAPDTGRFWEQVERCKFEVRPGPNRYMKWEVPSKGGYHDDLLLSAALVAALDAEDIKPRVISGRTREDV